QRAGCAHEPRACAASEFAKRVCRNVADPLGDLVLDVGARELQELRVALGDLQIAAQSRLRALDVADATGASELQQIERRRAERRSRARGVSVEAQLRAFGV